MPEGKGKKDFNMQKKNVRNVEGEKAKSVYLNESSWTQVKLLTCASSSPLDLYQLLLSVPPSPTSPG